MAHVRVIDNAIYIDGVPSGAPANLDETYELLRERHGMAWIVSTPPRIRRSSRWRASWL